MLQGMLRIAEDVSGEIRREIRAFTSRSKSIKTGNLARTFAPTILDKTPGGETVGAMSSKIYAAIQETGGIIRPKRAKWLTIPLSREAAVRGARGFDRLVYIEKTRRGNTILAEVIGNSLKPQFLLRKSVRLEAKRYLEKANHMMQPHIEAQMIRLIENATHHAAKRAKGGG